MNGAAKTLQGIAGLAKLQLLDARNLTMSFGEGSASSLVLRGISCTIAAGELTLLMGPSGSGKTTLVSILAGLLRPSSGDCQLCGSWLGGLDADALARLRRRHVGFVFQQYNLFPALTALENVAELLVLRGWSRSAAQQRAREALVAVGLAERLTHLPRELSGGQQQRVAIARAVVCEPQLIVGDEVTAALDTASAESVMALLRRQLTPQRAVLLVTHDPRFLHHADRVLEMHDGELVGDRRLIRSVSHSTMERA